MRRYRELQKDLFKSMKEPEDRIDMSWKEFRKALFINRLIGGVLGAILLYSMEVLYVWYYGII